MTEFSFSGSIGPENKSPSIDEQINTAYAAGDLETLQSIATQLIGASTPEELPESEKGQLQTTMGYIGALLRANPTGLRD